jgi:Mrp family chromosome partitioning ATPase
MFRTRQGTREFPRVFRSRQQSREAGEDDWKPHSVDATHATHLSAKHRFDEMKINFIARYAREGVKSVLVVGTARGDGASTAAFNFAASLARDTDTQVVLINADLRATSSSMPPPNPPGTPGLVSLAHCEMHPPVPAGRGNLHILPSGRGYADPALLFQSRRFDSFMVHLAQQFDYIVIDGPPLDEAPESIALSAKVDGVILVIDAQHTRRKIALRAKKRIEEVGGRLIGLVLNRRKYYVPRWLYKVI